jgi:hypothetical protein
MWGRAEGVAEIHHWLLNCAPQGSCHLFDKMRPAEWQGYG